VKKAIAAGTLAVGLAVVLSGCFVMRTLTYKDDTFKAGEKGIAKITVAGDTTDVMRGPPPAEYPFFLLVTEGGSTLANGGKFDTEGVFDGPVPLVKDATIAEFAADPCEETVPVARRGILDDQTAVVTEDPFVASNPRKFMDVKLQIRATETGNADGLGIFMGSWVDDGDGVPEDEDATDDRYACQPPYASVIRIKGGDPVH